LDTEAEILVSVPLSRTEDHPPEGVSPVAGWGVGGSRSGAGLRVGLIRPGAGDQHSPPVLFPAFSTRVWLGLQVGAENQAFGPPHAIHELLLVCSDVRVYSGFYELSRCLSAKGSQRERALLTVSSPKVAPRQVRTSVSGGPREAPSVSRCPETPAGTISKFLQLQGAGTPRGGEAR
jgi:hypothetical protein